MKRWWPVLALWLLMVGSGGVLSSWHEGVFRETDEPLSRNEVLLDVVGEFRTVIARYLWFKMDLFHEELEHADSDAHAEVIPLLRMVSLMDPTLTDSYDLIAWELVKTQGDYELALSLVDEGLSRNEDNFQLTFRKALILFQLERYGESFESAQRALEMATAESNDEFEILNSARLLYWSAKQLELRDIQQQTLDLLKSMRPDEKNWQNEQAELDEALQAEKLDAQ